MPTTTTVIRRHDLPRRSTGSAWACLLLASDRDRREAYESAAVAAGWSPIPCASVSEALKAHQRWRTQLTLVDLGGVPAGASAVWRRLAEQAVSHDRLVVVCDEQDDADLAEAECWARQAGVWVYLPSPEFGEGVHALFADALQTAEKISTPPRAAASIEGSLS